MRRPHRWCVLAGFVTLACSKLPPPPPPPGPDLTAFTLDGAPVRYHAVSHREQLTEALGQSTIQTSRLAYGSTVSVTTGDAGRGIAIIIDTVLGATGQLFLDGNRNAAGATVRGQLTRSGHITDWELDPGHLAQDPIVGQISAAYRQNYPRIPLGGIVPGAEWSDSTTIRRDETGTDIVLEAVTDYHAGFWDDTTAAAELAVRWTRRYTVSGEGEQMGQMFTVAGTGRAEGRHHFRADGRYLGSVVRDSSWSDITITALGLAVPLTQVGIDTVTIIP